MNWDWEKLQDKRQRQFGKAPDFGNIGDEFKRFSEFNLRIPGGPKVIFIALFVLWLASGIYIVQPDEVGVVQRFGAYDRTAGPGPHYHIPFPVESVQKPKVTEVRKAEVGVRTVGRRQDGSFVYKPIPEEAMMLTGDENIVDLQVIAQYQISDPVEWLFRVDNPTATIAAATAASIREVVGNKTIDSALTGGKLEIQNTTRELLQSVLDRYNMGVRVLAVQLQDVHPPKEVWDSFKDVASAQEDKIRLVNEAEAYHNDIIPKARGQAAAIINDAQAYRESVTRKATGEASRFLSVLAEYNKAKDITRERLLIETMEQVFANPDLEKVILSDESLKSMVPYLPLDRQGRVKSGDKGGK